MEHYIVADSDKNRDKI